MTKYSLFITFHFKCSAASDFEINTIYLISYQNQYYVSLSPNQNLNWRSDLNLPYPRLSSICHLGGLYIIIYSAQHANSNLALKLQYNVMVFPLSVTFDSEPFDFEMNPVRALSMLSLQDMK